MLMSVGCFLDAISDVIFQLSLINNVYLELSPSSNKISAKGRTDTIWIRGLPFSCEENNGQKCEDIYDAVDAFSSTPSGGPVRTVALVLLIVVALKEFSNGCAPSS